MLIYRRLHGTLAAEFIAECALEDVVDKIFVDEAVNELHTIQDMLRWAVSRFSAANIWYGHGTDNPWDEAVQLVLPSLYLPLDIPEDMRTARLTSSEKHRIVERVIRRVNERIPVAYLTNKAWFCGHEFYVDERVLVPRSPIGELINNQFAGLINHKPQHILDMCTGSGCIAIALAAALPTAHVEGWDISEAALAVARDNAAEQGVAVTFRHADLLNPPAEPLEMDLLVSNPPYVTDSERKDMERHVLDYEPETALFVPDTDALRFYRALARLAAERLVPGGYVAVEINRAYGAETAQLFASAGLSSTTVHQDAFGCDRFVSAQKPPIA